MSGFQGLFLLHLWSFGSVAVSYVLVLECTPFSVGLLKSLSAWVVNQFLRQYQSLVIFVFVLQRGASFGP